MLVPRVAVMGMSLDPLTMEQSIDRCLELIQERGNQHVVLNASKIVMAHRDEGLKSIIASCPMVNADGQSVVWASRILGAPLPERVAGIDLMDRLVGVAAKRKLGIYLLGAEQSVVETVSERFTERGALIVGMRNGYWTEGEEESVVADIALCRPDILFVAIPSPKKEVFLARWMSELNTGLAFGVGGSFDVVAGLTDRAPRLLQRMGFEWVYRLLQEPKRMFKRYLYGNTLFILLMLKYKLRPSSNR
jgi:N-acetylglucosaminyldiphosphoundecaprenol N-acetyl-beta-D-mannosaminyltransferase